MSGYLLCTSRLAEHPYLVEGTGIRLYSAEELCYYIVHNVQLLGEELLQEPLYHFLEQELGLTKETAVIRKHAEKKSELTTMLTVILRQFHYYTEAEIAQFQIQLENLSRQSPLERKCAQADFLMDQQKVQAARRIYEDLLRNRKNRENQRFYSLIAQRLAVCCIRQFRYHTAMAYLQQSYEEYSDERTLRQMYQLSLLSEEAFPQEQSEQVGAAKLYQWKQEYEQNWDLAQTAARSSAQAAVFEKDSIRRKEGLQQYLAEMKKTYRDGAEG